MLVFLLTVFFPTILVHVQYKMQLQALNKGKHNSTDREEEEPAPAVVYGISQT